MRNGIDAHIHLERYEKALQEQILQEAERCGIKGLIAVSMDLDSCKRTSELARQFPRVVFPAYGFHPEQELPSQTEQDRLFEWIRQHADEMVAVGEVGLPYYRRQEREERDGSLALAPYIRLLERFIQLSKELDMPIILHAVYEDAAIACDLLEKHQVIEAHFHWYKGPSETTERMISNGYRISLTPDILYEAEIQELATRYPLSLLLAETDGPWPFEGPFTGKMTHPSMIDDVLGKLADIKGLPKAQVEQRVYENTKALYRIRP